MYAFLKSCLCNLDIVVNIYYNLNVPQPLFVCVKMCVWDACMNEHALAGMLTYPNIYLRKHLVNILDIGHV